MLFLLVSLSLVLAQVFGDAPNYHFDFVSQTGSSITYNFNVTLAGMVSDPGYYICFNVYGISKLKDVNSQVTMNLYGANPNHLISDLQVLFQPNAQYIGGVGGGQYPVLGGSLLSGWPAGNQGAGGWDFKGPACVSTTLDVKELVNPFSQVCLINTCSYQSGGCTDSNTFTGQIKIKGFESSDNLAYDPITAETCGQNDNGAVEYVAAVDDNIYFNFQGVLGSEDSICKDIHASYFHDSYPTTKTPALEVDFSSTSSVVLENFALQFKYPDGSVKVVGGGGNVDLGTQVLDWQTTPVDFTAEIPSSYSTCYTNSMSSTLVPQGFTSVCVANGCTGGSCGASVYAGQIKMTGYGTSSGIDWVGSITQECTDVINAPTVKPTVTPEVQKGWIAAIILGSFFGCIILVFVLWLLVVGFRRFKRQYGWEEVDQEDLKAEPQFQGLMKHFGLV